MSSPLVQRLRPFTETIFAEMSALAMRTGAINLGQGFPDTDGPASMLDIARASIANGVNQYPPGPGIPALREAISASRAADHGQRFDPDTDVLVTTGATEAIAAAILAFVEPGDEVIALEPFYDSYQACIAMAQGVLRPVRLRQAEPGGRFALDPAELAAAVGPRTKLLLINSPHNPTGTALQADELQAIAAIAVERDLIVVTDEVYEHLTFSGAVHTPLGTLPGMAERTVTISSAGKSFNVTGWKIGWACGPTPLVAAVRAAKQFLTYVSGAPFQPAIAHALTHEQQWVANLRSELESRRDLLCDGLEQAGFVVTRPQGTYFAVADFRPLLAPGEQLDGTAFCWSLPDRCGVVAVPQQVFYSDQSAGAHLIRFAFCKQVAVIDAAVANLSRPVGGSQA